MDYFVFNSFAHIIYQHHHEHEEQHSHSTSSTQSDDSTDKEATPHNAVGTVPVKSLISSVKSSIDSRFPNVIGMAPSNRLSAIFRVSRDVILPSHSGKLPSRLFRST
mmetsp:Transcript_31226/g.44339  ORF Transcript_31226/g.44339 Transcript_31226/m.44339 type:complete len:107 (+) Transcript_31226:432-752(+)